MTRSISLARPMTGSSSFFFASSVRSRPNARSAGVFDILLAAAGLGRHAPRSASGGVKFGSSSLRISLRVRSISTSRLFSTRAATPSPSRSKPEQDVLGADVGMIERLRFLARQREHLLHARRVGNVADHLGLRAGADLLLDFHPHRFEIEPHFLQDVDGDALPELDQAEQQMLGADIVVVEAVGFFSGKSQDLLGARSEVIHRLSLEVARVRFLRQSY